MRFSTKLPSRLYIFIHLLILSLCSLGAFFYLDGKIQDRTSFEAITQVNEIEYWLLCVLWIFLVAIVIPKKISRPSDIFILIYLLGAVFWNATYWPLTGLLDYYKAIILLFILIFPIVVIRLLQLIFDNLFNFSQSNLQLKRSHTFFTILAFFLMLSFISSYQIAGQNGSFSFDNFRRLYSRDLFENHLLISYLFEMSVKGLVPFLAYLAGFRKSILYFIVAMFFSVYAFWLIALKMPIVISILMFGMGFLARVRLIENLPRILIKALFLFFIISFIEIYLNDYSVIINHGFRRMIMVISENQAYYFDAMWQTDNYSMFWSGLNHKYFVNPEFFIGFNYLHDINANVSVNAYQQQISVNGFFGYFGVVIGIAMLLLIFDYLYLIKKNEYIFAVTLLFVFLIIEQAFSVALLSSGIFLCILLAIFFSDKKIKNEI